MAASVGIFATMRMDAIIRWLGSEISVDASYVEGELGPGFGKIVDAARLVPNTIDGGINGFKIFAIKGGTLFARVGLQNGDVITQVNETSMKQPEQGFALYQAFQDEKEVPADFLEELMQLMKRVRIPFLFTGVMQRPRALLMSYDYTSKFPIFGTTDEAIQFLDAKYPLLLTVPHDGIVFGTPIEMVRSRLNGKPGEEDGEAAVEDEE
jgi:general secretion pathway protein C